MQIQTNPLNLVRVNEVLSGASQAYYVNIVVVTNHVHTYPESSSERKCNTNKNQVKSKIASPAYFVKLLSLKRKKTKNVTSTENLIYLFALQMSILFMK